MKVPATTNKNPLYHQLSGDCKLQVICGRASLLLTKSDAVGKAALREWDAATVPSRNQQECRALSELRVASCELRVVVDAVF